MAFDLSQGRDHDFAEISLKRISYCVESITEECLTWYSVFNVTTAASCARTIVSHARMTPSFVSVFSLSANNRRIRLPCNRYYNLSQLLHVWKH